jgi:hypothetical protein
MGDQAKKWTASRPSIPPEYGIPAHEEGILPWSHVDERMLEAKAYWMCTVDSEGRPHATPVDGVWHAGRLYFGGDPRTRRHRNLAANPNVCVHLENGYDVVILHGTAQIAGDIDRPRAERLAQESNRKYGYGTKPEEYLGGGVWEFIPQKGFGWKEFPGDVTKWAEDD